VAYDETGIVNLALLKIGTELITDLSDTNNPNAIKANALWEYLRDEVLEAFEWSFAKVRVQLAQSVSTPAFGWDYQYALPTDCLKIREMSPADTPYEIEGDYLVTDYDDTDADAEDKVFVLFTKRITDCAKYSPAFIKALSYRLAQDLSLSIRMKEPLHDRMKALYDQTLVEAKMLTNQEGYVEDEKSVESWRDVGR